MAAIQSTIFFQLRHFDPNADPTVISSQAGLLVSCRTAAHATTGFFWGRLADSQYGGRKFVLVIGLLACGIGILGYGYSRSFRWALAWQLMDGLFNSSIPMTRCMTAELHLEKKFLARSLTLLPLSASLGVSIGPVLAGFLAQHEGSCGKNESTCSHPFSMPSIAIAAYCAAVAMLVLLVLEEKPRGNTEDSTTNTSDRSIVNSDRSATDTRCSAASEIEPLLGPDRNKTSSAQDARLPTRPEEVRNSRTGPEPSLRRLWTSRVIYTMLATLLISGHLGTFSTLWPIFLSSPRQIGGHLGGLAMSSRQVAICMSLLGLPSVLLQITIYPSLNDRFGAVCVWHYALFMFPVAYSIAPLAALGLHETYPAHAPVTWLVVVLVLIFFITGRTGVTPATTMLINDCTPDARMRGTIHAMGTIVANFGKALFPVIVLPIFGYGLRAGITGLGFWCLAVLSVVTCIISGKVSKSDREAERAFTQDRRAQDTN